MLGFLSFATSQTGRWVVIGTVTVVIVWAFITRQNYLLSKLHKYRAELEARQTQDKIRTRNNEKLEKTRATRADPPRPVSDADELSDDQRRRLISD